MKEHKLTKYGVRSVTGSQRSDVSINFFESTLSIFLVFIGKWCTISQCLAFIVLHIWMFF